MNYVIPVLFLLSLPGLALAQKKEEKSVRACFEGYKSAILNDQGSEAVDFIDSRTTRYYSDILETTINADSMQINDLSMMDKLMILSIRHRTSKEDILSFDGQSLFVYAVKEGMVAKSSVVNSTIGKIQVEGTFAKGQLVVNGNESPFDFHFYKEEGQWKIDLTSIFAIGTKAFKTLLDKSGMEENEYLITLLELVTGRKPGNEIWEKVK